MKFSTLILTLMAAAAVTAAPSPELEVRDTCGAGYGGDQRRTNSPCNASNGDRHFCGCDRTGVVCYLAIQPAYLAHRVISSLNYEDIVLMSTVVIG